MYLTGSVPVGFGGPKYLQSTYIIGLVLVSYILYVQYVSQRGRYPYSED